MIPYIARSLLVLLSPKIGSCSGVRVSLSKYHLDLYVLGGKHVRACNQPLTTVRLVQGSHRPETAHSHFCSLQKEDIQHISAPAPLAPPSRQVGKSTSLYEERVALLYAYSPLEPFATLIKSALLPFYDENPIADALQASAGCTHGNTRQSAACALYD